MKNIFLFLFFLITSLSFSQGQSSIKGTVTDKAMNNEPLLMAHVQIKGDDTIVQTNFHGNFEITHLLEGEYTLIISYLGYESVEKLVRVTENSTVNVNADLNPIQIDLGDIIGMETFFNENGDVAQISNTAQSFRD